MPTRTSHAHWEGTLHEGNGTVELGSGAFRGPYSFASRFENESGTNPEELIEQTSSTEAREPCLDL